LEVTSDDVKAVFQELIEVEIAGKRFELTEKLVHPDFFDHTNPPGMQRGIDGHRAIVTLFHGAFSEIEWECDDLIAEGDKVVARTTFRGKHSGDFFGIPPTGKRVEMPGVHIGRIKDGKVIEHWGSNDDLGLMRQLGVVPG
jgi:predicted ester cyclase